MRVSRAKLPPRLAGGCRRRALASASPADGVALCGRFFRDVFAQTSGDVSHIVTCGGQRTIAQIRHGAPRVALTDRETAPSHAPGSHGAERRRCRSALERRTKGAPAAPIHRPSRAAMGDPPPDLIQTAINLADSLDSAVPAKKLDRNLI